MSWLELVLAAAVLLALAIVVFTFTRLAAAGARRAAAYFVTPVRPPSLVRLSSIVARWLEERQAAERAALRRDPPPLPSIVVALRAFVEHAQNGAGRHRRA